MSSHPQKCYTLSATRKKKKIVPSYHLHGHNLQNVSTAKYLGINIQDNLNWGLHLDTITNKANKTLGFHRRKLKKETRKSKKQHIKPLSAQSWSTRPLSGTHTLQTLCKRYKNDRNSSTPNSKLSYKYTPPDLLRQLHHRLSCLAYPPTTP